MTKVIDEPFNYSVPLTPLARCFPSKERRHSDASESDDLTYLSTPASNAESRLGMDSSDSRMDLDQSDSNGNHHASADFSVEEQQLQQQLQQLQQQQQQSTVDPQLMSSTFLQFSPSILPAAIHENEAADHALGDSLVRLGLNTVQVENHPSHVKFVNTINVLAQKEPPQQQQQHHQHHQQQQQHHQQQQHRKQQQKSKEREQTKAGVPVRVSVPPKIRRHRKQASTNNSNVVSLMPLPGDERSERSGGSRDRSIRSAPTILGNRSLWPSAKSASKQQQQQQQQQQPTSNLMARRLPPVRGAASSREFGLAPNDPLKRDGFVKGRAPTNNAPQSAVASSGVVHYNMKNIASGSINNRIPINSNNSSSSFVAAGAKLRGGRGGNSSRNSNYNNSGNMSGSTLPLGNSSRGSLNTSMNDSSSSFLLGNSSDDVTTRSMPISNRTRRLYPDHSHLHHSTSAAMDVSNSNSSKDRSKPSGRYSRNTGGRRGLGKLFHKSEPQEEATSKRAGKGDGSPNTSTAKSTKKKAGLFTKMFSNHLQSDFSQAAVTHVEEEKKKKERVRSAQDYGVNTTLSESGHGFELEDNASEVHSTRSGRSQGSNSIRSGRSFRSSYAPQKYSHNGGSSSNNNGSSGHPNASSASGELMDSSSRLSDRSSQLSSSRGSNYQ